MRKTIFFLLVFVALFFLIFRFGYTQIVDMFNLKPRAGLKIDSMPQSKVLLNGKDVGTTPYLDQNLTDGIYQVELDGTTPQASGSASWKGPVQLNGGTLSVINRELATAPTDIAGEVITLEKGKGLSILSVPPGASVNIDGQDKGKTPLTIPDISPGEHPLILSHDNYSKRNIRVIVTAGYLMHVQADLALAEADTAEVAPTPIPANPQVTVLQTPTGFLRVRASATTNGAEVGRVNPGDTLNVEEDDGAWLKIKLADGTEGYVSSQYIKKNP